MLGRTASGAPAGKSAKSRVKSRVKSKVFLSYSRRDLAFADKLAAGLEAQGIDVLIDRQDIVKGEAWRDRIYALIDQADTVVFLISPASVASPICQEEVAYAENLNKRFLPLLVREPIEKKGERIPVPAPLARINYVDYTKGIDDKAAFDDLVQALLVDLSWVREHTRLGELALKWQRDGEPSSQLLRGRDLEAAERWRDSHQKDHRPPTELHLLYIAESRKQAGRRRSMLVGSLVAGLVIAIALGAYGWWQKDRAETALLHGARTANNLVSNLAQRFRGEKGVPQSLVAEILERSEDLADNLMELDSSSEELHQGRGAALGELSDTYLTLGQDDDARTTAEGAIAAFRRLVEADPEDVSYRRNLASAYVRLGDVLQAMDDDAAALKNYQAADKALAKLPEQRQTAELLAVVQERIGAARLERGDIDGAVAKFERCLDLRKELPETNDGVLALSTCHSKIGAVAMSRQDWDGAVAAYRKSLAAVETIDAASLVNRVDWRRAIAVMHHQLGDALWRSGEPDAGLAEFERDLAMTKAVQGDDPERVDLREDLARSYERVGNISYTLGKRPEALAAFRASLDLAKTLNLEKSWRESWQGILVTMYQNTALLLIEMNDYDGALSVGRESVAYFAEQPQDTARSQMRLVDSHQNLSWYALLARDFDLALTASDAAIALAPKRTELQANKAHALMFLDHGPAAKNLYERHRGADVPDPSGDGTKVWEGLVLDDFESFREHDLEHPLMQEVQQTFREPSDGG